MGKTIRRTAKTLKPIAERDKCRVDPVWGHEVKPEQVIGGSGDRGGVKYLGFAKVPWHRECEACGEVEKNVEVKECKKCGKKLKKC